MARCSSTRAKLLTVARAGLGAALTRPSGLCVVNRLYRVLSSAQKRRFFYAFLDSLYPVEGDWIVDFAGRRITLPLQREFTLSWCAAVGFHGYDPEIHAFYEQLMRRTPPRVFFDVGASYGLHSLRFLVHGVRVVSFEPNAACHGWFRACCRRNGVEPEIHAVAIADKSGTAELAVPDEAAYEATIVSEVKQRWVGRRHVRTITVPQIALDDFVTEHGIRPDLLKVDTEGSERLVLTGARRVLESVRPLVVFESWPGSPDRDAIFALLESIDYRIERIALPPRPSAMSQMELRDAPGMNFLARPSVRA